MKKLSNFKIDGMIRLDASELKTITGGDNFTCYCGFVGGEWEDHTFSVSANSINSALDTAGSWCGGLGATCSGDSAGIM